MFLVQSWSSWGARERAIRFLRKMIDELINFFERKIAMNFETICFYAVVVIVLLGIARLLNQFIVKTNLTHALVETDNKALGIELSGYFLAVFVIIGGTLAGPGYDTLTLNFLWAFVYGIGGIVLMILATRLASQIMLKGNSKRAIGEGNAAVGLVSGSIYLSAGIIISGAVTGEWSGSHLPTLVFFVLGWFAFLFFLAMYRALTDYDDYLEIFRGNLAAAISYSANMIAISIIISHSVSGSFESWASNLLDFGRSLTAVAMLYFVRQFIVQGLLLGSGFTLYGGRLDREIADDHNIAAAAIEAATYIGAALLAVKLV